MKKNALLAVALTFSLGSAAAADMTEHQKVLYAVGQVLADQVGVFALTPEELKTVQKGLHDGVTGAKSAVDMTVYGPKIKPLAEGGALGLPAGGRVPGSGRRTVLGDQAAGGAAPQHLRGGRRRAVDLLVARLGPAHTVAVQHRVRSQRDHPRQELQMKAA